MTRARRAIANNPQVRSGVKFGNGDGTISAISLGSMCVKGWKGKTKWNPAGIEVVTQGLCPLPAWPACSLCWVRTDSVEYEHTPESMDIRGGPLTSVPHTIPGPTVRMEIGDWRLTKTAGPTTSIS